MTSTHKDADTRSRFRYFLALGVREALLIMTIVLSVYLFMALSSYSPLDPGWASTGDGGPVRNYAGRIGAWFSSLLIYFFGQVSYLFPMIVAVQSWRMFRKRHEPPVFNWPLFALRAAGVIVVIMTTTALLAIYSVVGWDKQSGGVLGAELAKSALAAFNLSGSTLILTAFNLVGITLATGLSWLKLMDTIGHYALRAVGAIQKNGIDSYAYIRKAIASKSAQRAEKQRQREVDRLEALSSESPEPSESVVDVTKRQPVINRREPVVTESDEVDASVSPVEPMVEPVVAPENSFKLLSNKVKAVARKAVPKTSKPVSNDAQGDDAEVEPELPELTEQVNVASAKSISVTEQKQIKISPFERKQADEKKTAKQKGLFDASDTSLPAISLLDPPETNKKTGYSPEALTHMSRLLEEKLADFGVTVEVVEVNPGPVITRFEIRPAPGVKVSKISNLVKDLARSLAVFSVRVVEVIPGKSVVGIEIPNEEREMVKFSEVLSTSVYERSDSPLTLALGNDIAGDPVVVNLAKMPHLLVAGTTGSGKSVGVNAMLLSMLFKARPDELRLIMVDPKMLELSIYDGIPHLLTPVVTDMKEAANALRWCVAEMERRYRLMAAMGVRNLAGFNSKVKAAREAGEPLLDPLWSPDQHLDNTEQARPELDTLPFIVVVIDEFADMMMIVGKKVEELIARIAQKARAAGIHLILATQRPSVDVITGLIKANVPTRISFQVSSKIDSRTILDQGGAEQLLGHGDMLYLPPGSGMPERVHGAFVSDDEVHRVVSDWKLRGEPDYLEDVLSGGDSSDPMVAHFSEDGAGGDSEQDALYDQAVEFVTETRRASISAVQRKLKIGYNRAANLVEAMEAAGVVSEAGHNGAREVLAPAPPRD